MARGKLFIIEAGDGSGKETQTRLLTQRLIREGHRVRAVTFPDYAADASMPVRMYLRGDFGTQADEVNPYAASTFFAIDRYASYRMKWGENYAAGMIILADRYTTSNMVHQAVKIGDAAERDAFLDWLYDFEFNKLGLPVPDAVFFLDMEPCAAERLIAARAQAKGEISTSATQTTCAAPTMPTSCSPHAAAGCASHRARTAYLFPSRRFMSGCMRKWESF